MLKNDTPNSGHDIFRIWFAAEEWVVTEGRVAGPSYEWMSLALLITLIFSVCQKFQVNFPLFRGLMPRQVFYWYCPISTILWGMGWLIIPSRHLPRRSHNKQQKTKKNAERGRDGQLLGCSFGSGEGCSPLAVTTDHGPGSWSVCWGGGGGGIYHRSESFTCDVTIVKRSFHRLRCVSGNGIGPEGAKAVADALKTNEVVRTIRLDGMALFFSHHEPWTIYPQQIAGLSSARNGFSLCGICRCHQQSIHCVASQPTALAPRGQRRLPPLSQSTERFTLFILMVCPTEVLPLFDATRCNLPLP